MKFKKKEEVRSSSCLQGQGNGETTNESHGPSDEVSTGSGRSRRLGSRLGHGGLGGRQLRLLRSRSRRRRGRRSNRGDRGRRGRRNEDGRGSEALGLGGGRVADGGVLSAGGGDEGRGRARGARAESDSLDTVGGSQVLGGLARVLTLALAGANLERLGVLEDARVAVELEDEAVEGLIAERGIDGPLVGLGVVGDTAYMAVVSIRDSSSGNRGRQSQARIIETYCRFRQWVGGCPGRRHQ